MKKLRSIFKKHYPIHDIDVVIKKLREAGATQIDCVKILKSELNISLREADRIVLNSKSWADTKLAILAFREEVDDNIERLMERCEKEKPST